MFGLGNFGVWELLILLVIVALIFGTSRLKNMGRDLGETLRNFKSGFSDAGNTEDEKKRDGE